MLADPSAEFHLVDSKVTPQGDRLELWKNIAEDKYDVCRIVAGTDDEEYDAECVTFEEAVKVYLG